MAKILFVLMLCCALGAHAQTAPRETNALLRTVRGEGVGQSVALSPDGNLWATFSNVSLTSGNSTTQKSVVKLWNTRSGALVRTLTQQNLNPSQLRFSPDGRTLLVSGVFVKNNQPSDGALFFYDLRSGKPRTQKLPQVWPVNIEYSNDGDDVVVSQIESAKIGGGDFQFSGRVTWRAVASGKVRRQIELGRNTTSNSMAFTPDGQTLALSVTQMNKDEGISSVRLIEARSGREQRRWNEGTGAVSLAWSLDGKTLAVAIGVKNGAPIEVGEIRLRDARSGAFQKTLRGFSGSINGLQFASADILFSGGWDGIVRRWNTRTGASQNLQFPAAEITALALSKDKKLLASSQWNSTSKLWNVAATSSTQIAIPSTRYQKDAPIQIAFTPKRGVLYTLGQRILTQYLFLRRPEDHTIFTVQNPRDETLSDVLLSPDDKTLILQSTRYRPADLGVGKPRADIFQSAGITLRVLDANSGAVLHTLPDQNAAGIALSPDGKRLAVSFCMPNRVALLRQKGIAIWDVANGTLTKTIALPFDANDLLFGALAWSDDGNLIVAQQDGIEIWNIENAQKVRTLKTDARFQIAQLRVSPDAKKLAVWRLAISRMSPSNLMFEQSVQFLSVETGATLRVLDRLGGDLSSVSWSSDSAHLAVATRRSNQIWSDNKSFGALRIYDLSGARRTLISNADTIYDAEFAPRTNTLAVSYGRSTMSGGVADLQLWTLPWLSKS